MKNNINQFKSLLHKLIKEELEGGEEKPQSLEKINYDLVLEPADLQSALSALGDIKNYGIYANNLRDPKIIQKIFGPSIPAQKANTAWRTWDTLNDEERFAKATDIRNRVPEDWKKLETELADKYDEWQTENGEGSFIEFVSTLKSTDLRNVKSNGFFGSRGANYYPMKTPDNLKKYSGVMTKDKDYVVSGDKIVFPQKTNPFETKDYLTKVLKTIMGNAKLQYNLAQKEADDQPTTTSNTQGAVEKINFVKTFDSPELAKKFMKFIPKDFAPKTELDGTKISVLDITDAQKKNLMATALKFIADNTKKPVKESIKNQIHRLIQEVLAENKEVDVVDTVTLDIPLFIRMLEYAKEDAQTDMDLHDVAEKAIALNKSKEMLSMEDYNTIIGGDNEELNEGLLNSFSDYETVFEMARHKAIPFAMIGILLVKYGIVKAKELIKQGKEEVMDAIEDLPKEEPSTMPTKQPIKLFKKKDNKMFNEELNEGNFDSQYYKPYITRDPNNPNFIKVFIKYPEGEGNLTALGQRTMSGQERDFGVKKAMDIAQLVAYKLEDTYNLEDIDITDNENGKIIVFAVSDDFIKTSPKLEENKK